jgi:putative heme-binding domain-containing protein
MSAFPKRNFWEHSTVQWAVSLAAVCSFCVQAADEPATNSFYLPKSPVAAAYVLSRKSNRELIAAPRSEFVYVALLQRKGLEKKYRLEALDGLATIHKTDRLTELLVGLVELDKKGEASEPILRELIPILVQSKSAELAAKRDALEKLAGESQLALTRQIGYAGLVIADASAEKTWSSVESDQGKLADLLLSIPLVPDEKIRAPLFSKIEPLLHKAEPADVRRAAITAIASVPGHNKEIFTALAQLVREGTEIGTATASLQKIPRASWSTEEAGPLVENLSDYLKKLPVEKRAEPEGLSIFQFASDLTALLPAEKKANASKSLRALGVNVFVIRTVPEQMLYDKTLVVVEAGKPVQLILINDDAMPHNLVVILPDSLERVGNLAEKMPLEPDLEGRLYIPDVPEVVRATKLIDSGQQAKLSFNAPRTPGNYQYICTFPGHWRRMIGTLAVVKDVEAYLASHVAPKVTEWKIGDFSADIAGAGAGRNLGRGRELFTKLACATCHKLGPEGVNFGPDLSDVFKRFNNDRADVLRQILEPSLVISNLYQNVQFDLKSDDTLIGIVLKEDADSVTIQSGPSDSLIKTFKKSDIASQRPSTSSVMPLGLLNTLSKEEVFDLLAYLESGGKPHEHQH